MSIHGGKLNYRKGYNHRATNEKVVGEGVRPPAPVPRNILVDPLKGPPMTPIKDPAARPGHGQEG